MNNWEAFAWAAWLAAFFILEGIGLLRRKKNGGMTLTYFIEQHFPRWILAAILGWMVYHFLIARPAGG